MAPTTTPLRIYHPIQKDYATSLLMPVFRMLAARARKHGIEQELIRRYCH